MDTEKRRKIRIQLLLSQPFSGGNPAKVTPKQNQRTSRETRSPLITYKTRQVFDTSAKCSHIGGQEATWPKPGITSNKGIATNVTRRYERSKVQVMEPAGPMAHDDAIHCMSPGTGSRSCVPVRSSRRVQPLHLNKWNDSKRQLEVFFSL